MDPSVMGGSTLDAYEEVMRSPVDLHCISLHLPTPPHISPHQATSPHSSPLLPTSPHISPHLPTSPQVMDGFLHSSALARVKPAMASTMAPADFGAITRGSMEVREA